MRQLTGGLGLLAVDGLVAEAGGHGADEVEGGAAGHLEPLAPPVVVLQPHPQPLQLRHHRVLLVEAEEGEAGEHIDTHIWHHIVCDNMT